MWEWFVKLFWEASPIEDAQEHTVRAIRYTKRLHEIAKEMMDSEYDDLGEDIQRLMDVLIEGTTSTSRNPKTTQQLIECTFENRALQKRIFEKMESEIKKGENAPDGICLGVENPIDNEFSIIILTLGAEPNETNIMIHTFENSVDRDWFEFL